MKEIKFLEKVSLFSDLNIEQLQALLRCTRNQSFKKGDVIIREDEPGDTMFLVYEGAVEISKSIKLQVKKGSYSTFDKVLAVLKDSDHSFFGELAMVQTENRSATATATKDTNVIILSRDDFQKLAVSDPLLGYKMMNNISQELSARLRKQNEDILKLITALSLALSK